MAKESFNFLEYFNEPKEFIKTKPVSFPEQNQAVSLKGKGSLTKAAYIMNINRKRCIFKRNHLSKQIGKDIHYPCPPGYRHKTAPQSRWFSHRRNSSTFIPGRVR